MCKEENIYEYEYLDDDYKNLRERQLKDYLLEGNEMDYNFLDLQMYNKNKSLKDKAFDVINTSVLNSKVVLTQQQLEILSLLENNSVFVSAPTSFGKTFVALEFIKRNENTLNNIVFIVPTIALMNELLKKIYGYFSDKFNICINSSEDIEEKNIFIFVPERSDNVFINKIKNVEIDLLVFDEIYKLKAEKKTDITGDDRLISMNRVYLTLLKKSNKILLLGPFIRKITFDQTKLKIIKFYTNYMPVCSTVYKINSNEWQTKLIDGKTLVYFKSPEEIYLNIDSIIENTSVKPDLVEKYSEEIKYLKNKIGDNWYVIEMLKRGIGIHHGKIPMFLRKFFETEYNFGSITTLLCTSTLMEGINTPTDRLFIVGKISNSFELNNLIGRVGRLNPQFPILGNVYICNDDVYNIYKNKEKWLDLKILAENKTVFTNDEILFLNKKAENTAQMNQYREKLSSLEEKGITTTEIKKYDVSFDKVYKFSQDNYAEKFAKVNTMKDCIDLSLKLLRSIAYEFKIDKFYGLFTKGEKQEYLQYKYYIERLLNGVSVKELVYSFNKSYNLNANTKNVNLFIDKIFVLKNYIKFTLSKILNYFELFNVKNNNNCLNMFRKLLSEFSDYDGNDKILDDLGIEEEDFNAISNYVKYGKINSTSNVIKTIKKNKNEILGENISPFTKHNIKNL